MYNNILAGSVMITVRFLIKYLRWFVHTMFGFAFLQLVYNLVFTIGLQRTK